MGKAGEEVKGKCSQKDSVSPKSTGLPCSCALSVSPMALHTQRPLQPLSVRHHSHSVFGVPSAWGLWGHRTNPSQMCSGNVGIGVVPKRTRIKGRQGIAKSIQETMVMRLEGNRKPGVKGAETDRRFLDASMPIKGTDYNKRMNRVCGWGRGHHTRIVNPQDRWS